MAAPSGQLRGKGRARWADAIEASSDFRWGRVPFRRAIRNPRAPRSKPGFAERIAHERGVSPYSRANAHLCKHNRILPGYMAELVR